jgi:hypothetical protein
MENTWIGWQMFKQDGKHLDRLADVQQDGKRLDSLADVQTGYQTLGQAG